MEESLEIQRELGNQKGISVALNNLALVFQYEGDTDSAIPYLQESLTINRTLGAPFSVYIALLNLGEVSLTLQRFNLA